MASINTDSKLESQIPYQDRNQRTTENIFSVRNIVIGLVGLIFAVSCILTYAFKDQIFGSEDVLALDENDSSPFKNFSGIKNQSNKTKKNNSRISFDTGNGKQKDGRSIEEKNKTDESKNETGKETKTKTEKETKKLKPRKEIEIRTDEIHESLELDEDEELEDQELEDQEIQAEYNMDQCVNGNIIYFSPSLTEIFSICSDSKIPKQLTRGFEIKEIDTSLSLVLSFDGKNIMAQGTENNFSQTIWIRSLKGKNNFKKIFESFEQYMQIFLPSFSPDGSKIIFAIKKGGYSQTYRLDLKNREGELNEQTAHDQDIIKISTFKEWDCVYSLFDFKYTPDGKSIIYLIADTYADNYQGDFKLFISEVDSKNEDKIKVIKLNLKSIELQYEHFNSVSIDFQSFSICSRDGSEFVFRLIVNCYDNLSTNPNDPPKYQRVETKYVLYKFVLGGDNDNFTKIYETNDQITDLLRSPDGESIAFIEQETIKILKIDTENDTNDLINVIEGRIIGWISK